MLENLKVNDRRETLLNSVVSRATLEVMLLDIAEKKARENNTNIDYEYKELLTTRQKIIDDIIDQMEKYV